MEKRRFCGHLVAALTLGGLIGLARADAPGTEATPAATAARAHKKKRAPKAPKVSFACQTDEDCTTTKMADGDCCPSLCQPRVVAKKSAAALAAYAKVCEKPGGFPCPVPECAPPNMSFEPACVSGKCEARALPSRSRD